MVKLCERCGMELVKYSKSKYCAECRKKALYESRRTLKELVSEKLKREERMKYYHSDSLILAVIEADKQGISYGQYQANKFAEMRNQSEILKKAREKKQ